MQYNKKKIKGFMLLIGAMLVLPLGLFAQPGFPTDTTDAPIDGGVSLLVIAGVGYGAKKLKERKSKNLIDKLKK